MSDGSHFTAAAIGPPEVGAIGEGLINEVNEESISLFTILPVPPLHPLCCRLLKHLLVSESLATCPRTLVRQKYEVNEESVVC